MGIRKAVITAGGWGTRFLPVTKSLPKEMLPVLNKPLIQHSIEEAVAVGVETVIIVVSEGKKSILDYFTPHLALEHALQVKGDDHMLDEVAKLARLSTMVELRFVTQEDPRGLGHAVLTSRELVGDEPFLLFLPDDVFEQGETVIRAMARLQEATGGCVLSVKAVSDEDIERYGIIEPTHLCDHTCRVRSLVEKPTRANAPSHLAIMGRYVLTPQVFDVLEDLPPGKNGEIQLTDALQRLVGTQGIHAYEIVGERYDCGTVAGWLEANLVMALRDPETGPALRTALQRLQGRGDFGLR